MFHILRDSENDFVIFDDDTATTTSYSDDLSTLITSEFKSRDGADLDDFIRGWGFDLRVVLSVPSLIGIRQSHPELFL